MNITLFGGAFDPPHNGHLQIARELLRQRYADEVWFLPVKYHAFDKKLTADEHRLAMLEKILEPQMKIEKFEMEQSSTNYTYHTLKELTKKYSEHTFSFAIGSDNIWTLHKWDELENLVEEFTFYVYPRKGYATELLYKNLVILDEVQEVDVSSTEVREIVKTGQPISDLVPPVIEQYIQEHNLYKE